MIPPSNSSWMQPPRRLLLLALAALIAASLAALAASPALSHVLPQERTVIVEISTDRLEILIEHREPPGSRADLLLARYDLDADGELSSAEAKLAAPLWIKHVLYGLQFEVVGEAPRALEPEIKLRREKKGALSAAVYARWELAPLAPGATRTVRVHVLPQPNGVATGVQFQAAPGLLLDRLAVPVRFRATPDRAVLNPGEHAQARARQLASPAPATVPTAEKFPAE